jgi:hypothetical protein
MYYIFLGLLDPDPLVRGMDPDPSIQGFGSGSAWIRINLSCWIRIRIQIADPDPGGQKLPQKIEKRTEFSSGCSLLRAEGFSCSLGVLYGGLGISKLQFLIKKI